MKNLKFRKFNILGILLGLVLVFVGVGSLEAQQVLPEGGNSFETATLIRPGNYQAGPLNEEVGSEKFYFLQGIRPGQEVKIRGVFRIADGGHDTINRIVFFNENKEELFNVFDLNASFLSLSGSWLPNANQPVYKYYLKIADEVWGTESFTLEISLVERYDATGQTDAGDTFDKAMTIAIPGTYKGYLSGYGVGTDLKDFYRIAVKQGQPLTLRVTPPSGTILELAIYNTNRQLLQSAISQNPGAIVSASFSVIDDANLFLSVTNKDHWGINLVNYTLDISIAALPREGPVIDGPREEVVWPPQHRETLRYSEGFALAMAVGWIIGYFVLGIILIIYMPICLSFLAKKTDTPNGWFAWVPIVNIFLMLQIAQKPLWWLLLTFIPIVNAVILVIVWMAIAERIGKPNWLGILIIIPFIGFIVPGYLAFSKNK